MTADGERLIETMRTVGDELLARVEVRKERMTADHPRQVELEDEFVPELAIVFAPSSEPRNSQSTGKEAA